MSPKKVALVTGANTGIGRETVVALAKQDIKVFLACRDMDKGREALAHIQDEAMNDLERKLEKYNIYWYNQSDRQSMIYGLEDDLFRACPGADLELLHLDLKYMDSIRKCASEFKSRKLPLNILVNNAGINYGKPSFTPEGIDLCPQVNFLGPYTFTRLLEEELTLGAPSRVVNVSSITHRIAEKFNPADFLKKHKYGRYANCKLANVMFTHEAQVRWQGQGIESSAVDPGAVASDIWRKSVFDRPPVSWMLKALYAPTWDGAKPVIHAATARYGPHKKDNMPFRFFARGAFASPVITTTSSGVLDIPQKLAMIVGSLIDWPVRRLSGGAFWSEVKEVPAHEQAYDTELTSSLWNQAAVLAGFESVKDGRSYHLQH